MLTMTYGAVMARRRSRPQSIDHRWYWGHSLDQVNEAKVAEMNALTKTMDYVADVGVIKFLTGALLSPCGAVRFFKFKLTTAATATASSVFFCLLSSSSCDHSSSSCMHLDSEHVVKFQAPASCISFSAAGRLVTSG